MLISSTSTSSLKSHISERSEIFCSGLFLSARWFVFSQVVERGVHMIVLPTQETAEYCSADLYNLIEGDCIFYLPSSGKGIEKSNYKSSLSVQRTSAVSRILSNKDELLIIVTYPEALEELVPDSGTINNSIMKLHAGDEISYDELKSILSDKGFEKVDFVSAPGHFAIRGSIVDIFSFYLSIFKPFKNSSRLIVNLIYYFLPLLY